MIILCESEIEALFIPVFRSVVFILVLDNEPLAGEVIGLALAPPPELDLQDVGMKYWRMKH